MKCKGCKKDKELANKFHGLCLLCNKKRLEAGKPKKGYTLSRENKKSNKQKETRLKREVSKGKKVAVKQGGRKSGKNLLLDELFYEECFNHSDHRCEECNKQLPTEFRDGNGKISARFRYSHIVAKSIAPELRHNIENINHLCHTCHFKWDMQDRKSMRIYKKNKVKFPQYLE